MRREPVQATIEGAWREVGRIEDAFARGEIDQAGWHARMAAIVVPAYLAGVDPRSQSGYCGTEADWRQARSLVSDAIPRSGTFLDVGCANGLLMESVQAWCAERGLVVEPYGVDIAPELVALARTRVPQWADRVFEENVASWFPPLRFDLVRTGLEYTMGVYTPIGVGFATAPDPGDAPGSGRHGAGAAWFRSPDLVVIILAQGPGSSVD